MTEFCSIMKTIVNLNSGKNDEEEENIPEMPMLFLLDVTFILCLLHHGKKFFVSHGLFCGYPLLYIFTYKITQHRIW